MSSEDYPTDDPAVVTCGLPYANGDLHVGHMRGYVSADVYARALRKLGQETAYVCGSDMHGTPVAVNARKEDVDPETFALEWHDQYQETFPKFNVDFDNYGHTHDETNTELTQEIVRALDDGGHVYETEIQVAWDPELDMPLPDRYVEGTCPYCGAQARGDECDEGCGRHLEPGEIEDPVSVETGNPAEYRTRPHRFLRLSDFQEYLQGFIDRLEGTSNAINQPKEWIEGELRDWCITRDLDWGIDYPGESVAPEEQRNEGGEAAEDGADDLVLYVWVDAPIEYVASTKQYTERVGDEEYDWEAVWKDDGVSASDASGGSPDSLRLSGGEIIHVIGRDIIQHHTVFWPSMLRGSGYSEPRAVLAHGFMTLDGKGFSTSRNRAVWAQEYLDEGFHPDLLRYYLTTTGSLQEDIDFSWDGFRERVNSDLADDVGNFVYRSLLFAERNWDGTPDTEVSEKVQRQIDDAVEEFGRAVNEYELKAAGEAGVRLARFGNEYIQQNEPWKLTDDDPEQAAQVIRDCVQIVRAVAVLLAPFTPAKSQEIWTQLGEVGDVTDATLDAATESPPAEFGDPTELFDKIDDDRVAELNEKLQESIAAATADADAADDDTETDEESMTDESDTDLEPLSTDRIDFDEFQELDVRVGRIETAGGIEGADDLARLEVDVGHEVRQIVAGIKQLHDLDELPGTKVVVLVNLEKAELFGVESNGMVLAAGEDADLLTTHGDSEPGTKVR